MGLNYSPVAGSATQSKTNRLIKRIIKHKYLYLLILPGCLYYLIFKYLPMFGILIAFKDYKPSMGIVGFFTAPWVGFKNFLIFFKSSYSTEIITNTLLISLYKIVFGFPAPIILALLLNEVNNKYYKKVLQTVTYLPHFLSWVIVGGMMFELLSTTSGSLNEIIKSLTGETINFLANPKLFRSVLVVSDIWKGVGWGSIIYLAALAGVSSELYEAALIDGANRFQKMIYIALPSIVPAIIMVFLLRLGGILDAGFEQIFILYSPMVYNVSDIIDTYVYREGLVNARYGYSTAVGLAKSAIAMILILTANKIIKKSGNNGII